LCSCCVNGLVSAVAGWYKLNCSHDSFNVSWGDWGSNGSVGGYKNGGMDVYIGDWEFVAVGRFLGGSKDGDSGSAEESFGTVTWCSQQYQWHHGM